MEFFGGLKEQTDTKEITESGSPSISREAREKFDILMRDGKESDISETGEGVAEKSSLPDLVTRFLSMFAVEDELPKDELREGNSTYTLDGNDYETDDYGRTYKKNGEILPCTEYTVNGSSYKTDEKGRLISCDAIPKYTDAGSRNIKEQKESGGDERQEYDDGGHIMAKILGGAEGAENLVPMRRTINRGDYKKMENEIVKALQEGKPVTIHIDLVCNGDSRRPSKIRSEYTMDDQKTIVEFDNDEKSTELLDVLCEKIEDDDYDRLKSEIDDMAADGIAASVTSVKSEYDVSGNPTKVTVGVLDESTGAKDYRYFTPRKE